MSAQKHNYSDPYTSDSRPRVLSLQDQVVELDRHIHVMASQLDEFGRVLHQLRQTIDLSAPASRYASSRTTLPSVEAASEPDFLLRLLGPLELVHGDTRIDLSRRGKSASVLKALALSRGRRVSPSLLADWVWPDKDADEARRCLQTTVSAIRRTVQDVDRSVDLIQYRSDAYLLDPRLVTDVDLFDAAYDRALAFESAGSNDLALASLIASVAIYRDDVDVDEFEDLRFVIDRERLSGLNLHMLGKISSTFFQLDRWEECIVYATRLLARDPGREDAHRLIIRSYVQMGQRSRGLHHYHLCRTIMQEHYDAGLEPETEDLLHEVL